MKKMFLTLTGCFILSTSFIFNIKGETNMPAETYSDAEKQFLVNLARASIYCYLENKTAPKINEDTLPEKIFRKRGCFVTLTSRGDRLRGCIGNIIAREPLLSGIINRAVDAAVRDPRFMPLKYKELKDIKVEVSILTKPVDLNFSSPADLLSKLNPGKDGVVLQTPYGSSTFLPQVWDQLPNKVLFLNHLSAKHGAPQDIWKTSDDIKVSIYHAIVFHENEYGNIIVGNNGALAGSNGATAIGKVSYEDTIHQEHKINPGSKIDPLTILSPDSDID